MLLHFYKDQSLIKQGMVSLKCQRWDLKLKAKVNRITYDLIYLRSIVQYPDLMAGIFFGLSLLLGFCS